MMDVQKLSILSAVLTKKAMKEVFPIAVFLRERMLLLVRVNLSRKYIMAHAQVRIHFFIFLILYFRLFIRFLYFLSLLLGSCDFLFFGFLKS